MKRELMYKGKVYKDVMEMCNSEGVNYVGFTRYTIRRVGKSMMSISDEDVVGYFLKYIELNETKYKVRYDGKVYDSISAACNSVNVSENGFRYFCNKNYGNLPSMMDPCSVEKALVDYVNLKKDRSYTIMYNGKCYNTITGACKDLGINRVSFINFCNKTTGKILSDLSPEERSKLFETYAKAKGKN